MVHFELDFVSHGSREVSVADCVIVSFISIPSTPVNSIAAGIADDVDDIILSVLVVGASPGGLWQVSTAVD